MRTYDLYKKRFKSHVQSMPKERGLKADYRKTKKGLVLKHFYEVYEQVKGGYSTVTARQLYYALRTKILHEYGKNLDKPFSDPERNESSDWYGHFTQEILTDLFDKDPDLEASVYLEDRGEFFNPFFESELPLGTRRVRDAMSETYQNRI